MLFTEDELSRLKRVRMRDTRVGRGSVNGRRVSRQTGAGEEFHGHRAYSHGDDIRRVDWNAFSRLDQLFVKLYEAPGRLRLHLVLDNTLTMDFGAWNKLQFAKRLLGVAGWIALANADKIHVSGLRDSKPTSATLGHESAMLETLDHIRPSKFPPDKGLLSNVTNAGRDALVIFASDFQRPDAMEVLEHLRLHSVRCVAVGVFSQDEIEPTMDGWQRMLPVGQDAFKARIDTATLAAYRQEVIRCRDNVAASVKNLGCAWLDARSDLALSEMLDKLATGGVIRAST